MVLLQDLSNIFRFSKEISTYVIKKKLDNFKKNLQKITGVYRLSCQKIQILYKYSGFLL
jgi:hypothetical protein